MLQSLAFIFILGILLASIFEKIRFPKIVGYLITGIILGPYVLNVLDDSLLSISSELRQIALIIILLKAGLSLNLKDLKKVSRPAIMMSFIPASFEIIGYILFAPMILNISFIDSAIMGSVMGAVSPAVVVPRMVNLMENGYGTSKSIPQMVLTGSSLDDIYVIVLFTTFTSMATGGNVNVMDFVNIPISIILGVLLGIAVGYIISEIFRHTNYDSTFRVIIILATSFLLMTIETYLKDYISISGLLAIVSMGCMIKVRCKQEEVVKLSSKFGKLWLPAEVLLFTLVGAAVDIRYTLNAGIMAVVMILVALLVRAIGVNICLLGTNLNKKERLFCTLAYLPKATVQAAIGSVPLAMGLSCGNIVLSIAVVGILITAPLGAFAMDLSYQKLLEKSPL